MCNEEELLKAACALLENDSGDGEEETRRIMEILEPFTREETDLIQEIMEEEYPLVLDDFILAQMIRARRDHPERYKPHGGYDYKAPKKTKKTSKKRKAEQVQGNQEKTKKMLIMKPEYKTSPFYNKTLTKFKVI